MKQDSERDEDTSLLREKFHLRCRNDTVINAITVNEIRVAADFYLCEADSSKFPHTHFERKLEPIVNQSEGQVGFCSVFLLLLLSS